ncbi:hypothetical protein M3Y97_00642700 [Aphelenchoides bicaudatus]|nr:hypothetical protein M3Y97_00642700 [Aphelenchoides bicaudatus]
MFRDLITVIAYGIFFSGLYFLFLENEDRMEKNGRGLPIIGVFLAWLSPLFEDLYEKVIGRRLRARKRNSMKNKHSSNKEESKTEQQNNSNMLGG